MNKSKFNALYIKANMKTMKEIMIASIIWLVQIKIREIWGYFQRRNK
jgi:hypothetical protein